MGRRGSEWAATMVRNGPQWPPPWPVPKPLKPNSITLAGSKLVRSLSQTGTKPNSITLSGSKLVRSWSQTGWKLVTDLLARASSLLAS